MRAFLIVPVFLFCCVRNRGNIVIEAIEVNTPQTDRNCLLDMGELLMKIGSMEARLKATEQQVASQSEDKAKSKVAFSAGLRSPRGDIGNWNSSGEAVLQYRKVFTNIGNAYSPNTGIFTAPAKGVYHFSYYHVHNEKKEAYASLYKNTQRLMSTAGFSKDGHYTTANGVTVQLEAGDEVYVNLRHGAWLYDDEYNYSNFNGMLLFTL